MKKGAPFEWNELCRKAFMKIKEYLSHPLVLGAPIPRKPLILYIAAQENSLGTLCVQENGEGKDITRYYLSRTLVGAKLTYSPIEKICLSLIFPIQRLRHCMQAHAVQAVFKADPIMDITTEKRAS